MRRWSAGFFTSAHGLYFTHSCRDGESKHGGEITYCTRRNPRSSSNDHACPWPSLFIPRSLACPHVAHHLLDVPDANLGRLSCGRAREQHGAAGARACNAGYAPLDDRCPSCRIRQLVRRSSFPCGWLSAFRPGLGPALPLEALCALQSGLLDRERAIAPDRETPRLSRPASPSAILSDEGFGAPFPHPHTEAREIAVPDNAIAVRWPCRVDDALCRFLTCHYPLRCAVAVHRLGSTWEAPKSPPTILSERADSLALRLRGVERVLKEEPNHLLSRVGPLLVGKRPEELPPDQAWPPPWTTKSSRQLRPSASAYGPRVGMPGGRLPDSPFVRIRHPLRPVR